MSALPQVASLLLASILMYVKAGISALYRVAPKALRTSDGIRKRTPLPIPI